jgi:ATP/maltotriose-dependent transcriptional regulator MalT/DNA-binding SARP family transcriptional activator
MNFLGQNNSNNLWGQGLLFRTKLQPPRLRRSTLPRARLLKYLERTIDFRLTLLIAPTGYGKSTLLGTWIVQLAQPYAWYNLGSSDSDSFLFLLHLIYAFREQQSSLGNRTLQILEQEWSEFGNRSEERQMLVQQVLRLFINELCEQPQQDLFLVFDDFHELEAYPDILKLAQDFILALPTHIHVVISSRQRPDFEWLARWQAQREVLVINKEALAFTPSETSQLFAEAYAYTLTPAQAKRLAVETEGWVIALQMVWQNLQNSENSLNLDTMLESLTHNLDGLFDYLAQEVLSHQEPALQRFLLESSVLRRMNASLCDFVLQLTSGEGASRLRYLSEAGLFIIVQGGGLAQTYRYHHLFSEFLYMRLQALPDRATQLHSRAALYYEQQEQFEEALYHWLAAQAWPKARNILENGRGQYLIETGQMERLERYLGVFPAKFLELAPALLLLWGDCLRLVSRFEEALQCYTKAIVAYEAAADLPNLARAFRSLALVYLDTVQPAAAAEWLERALELSQNLPDPHWRAILLRDLAENKLNQGRPLEAEELRRQARLLVGQHAITNPDDVRILLRSGRINQAIESLEYTLNEAEAEVDYTDGPRQRPGRSHREGLLVLSLLNATRGEGELAEVRARHGIKLTHDLHTPFAEAVAWLRLGHALTVQGGQTQAALEAYQQGLELGTRLKVRRLRAEGLMGLALLEGSHSEGSLALVRKTVEEGLQVARRAGDEWIEGFLTLALAAALVEHGENSEAAQVAQLAYTLLENCGDQFGQIAARLWLILANHDQQGLQNLQSECKRFGYVFLLERPTLYGPKSPATLAQLAVLTEPASEPPDVKAILPGTNVKSSLHITTLGSFSVRRADGSEIEAHGWQRDKARQLFQLLVTYRSQPLTKDRLLDYLWPNNPPGSSDASFKVVLNTLMQVLEPARSRRAQSSYVERSGTGPTLAYKLQSHIWLDVAEFERLLESGRKAEQTTPTNYQVALDYYVQALQLYQGDFLPDCLYEDWAMPERERLLNLFLTNASHVAYLQTILNQWEACAAICRLILNHDNCWEEAYRLLMLALWKQNNRVGALRTYEKCVKTLDEELGISPMLQTVQLYEQILQA